MMKRYIVVLGWIVATIAACQPKRTNHQIGSDEQIDVQGDTLAVVEEEPEVPDTLSAADIELKEDLLFEKYYLEPVYEYKDTTRSIKLDQIKEKLAYVENLADEIGRWGVIENYRNGNGEAPTVANYVRNEYKRVSDTLGVERYQSAPLYQVNDSTAPIIYGRDGWLTHLLDSVGGYYHITPIRRSMGEYWIPKRYLRQLPEDTQFETVIFVDRGDQNITTTERTGRGQWVIRSTNPATTGKRQPPYQMETPLGIFLLQQKKAKMFYTHDGSSEIAGYAPWASRFTNGAYIHGVPVNDVNAKPIEYSWSLGTVPRSHMCVRNASSHAKFIYDRAPVDRTLIIVIE
ncbi:MAG: L,D-transpeptidase [Porphyromonas sp.]|nr:L,D-transpeptidase [Porphyromonas sp.]